MGCCVICLVEERIEPRAFGSSFRRAKSSRLNPLLHGATRFQRTRNDGSSATRKYPCVSRVRGTLLAAAARSEEHTSELQSLMRISYAVFCLKKKKTKTNHQHTQHTHKHHTTKIHSQDT